jgi:hypothetical protein
MAIRHSAARTRAAAFPLQTQLRSADCYQGSTWGFDNRGLWVANCCRATFRTGNDDYRHHEDADDNGCVSWEELRNRAAIVFDALDVNDDGLIASN